MIRASVVLFHLGLSAVLGLELILTALQLRANGAWEQRFYGAVSPTTIGFGRLIAVYTAITAVQLLVLTGWTLRVERTTTLMLGVTGLLILIVTPSVGWMLLASAALVVVDEIWRRLPAWAELLAGDDDDDWDE